jgi:putative DNA primase/helicase
MSARAIALALAGRRAQRLADGGFLVPCPVSSHGKGRGDRSPSLRIGDGQTRLLVHCYAGCDRLDVLDELRRRGLIEGAGVRSHPRDRVRPQCSDDDRHKRRGAADRIWREAISIEGTPGASYFHGRGIDIARLPDCGGLRWHTRCPWESGTTGCVVARYTDAITGKPCGIWRRPIDGQKPRTLGPMAGCVIRLWPDIEVTTGLVLAEGIETAAAASQIVHRSTLLQPTWAAGCAGNMANFPALPGVEALTLIVDNDHSGTGQDAAAACAHRWLEAGREVIRLTPRRVGADFNDILEKQRGAA